MDYVIDIETLSTQPTAAILSIGMVAVGRDDDGEMHIVDELETRVDPHIYDENPSFHISPGTLSWWDKQPNKTREAAFSGLYSLPDALDDLHDFIMENSGKVWHEDDRIWVLGPSFDIAILEHAHAVCAMDVPWKYDAVRDLRTRFEDTGVMWKQYLGEGEAHTALGDAVAEAKGFMASQRILDAMKEFHETVQAA